MKDIFMNSISSEEIALFLKEKLIGKNIILFGVSSINNLKKNTLSFISNFLYTNDITKNTLILVHKKYEIPNNSQNSYIRVLNPRLAFTRVVEKFFYKKKKSSISKSAIIARSAKLGKNVSIGENVIIEKNCNIGENSIIDHNVVILENCSIGSNCRINTNVTIGNEGLSSLKNENHELVMMRHTGNVIIENNVEIGSNSTIARGIIDSTVIKKYTKIGPQVNIGHNTVIEANCQIAGRAHFSGSVHVEENCFIGANCSIKESVKIGNNSKVGIGSVIIRNVKSNSIASGLEAIDLRSLVRIKKKINYK